MFWGIMSLDFKGLAASLCANAWMLLPEWLPGGTRRGKEYVCGSIQGGEGESFSVNLESGVWKEFGNGEQVGGSDLIALYAAIKGLSQGEAYKALDEKFGGVRPQAKRDVASPPGPTVAPPPADSTPDMRGATASWVYRDSNGAPIYYVARYDTPANGKPASKSFRPFSWDGSTWVSKSPPSPRPLYGLELLAARPTAPVLLTEGEKAADAARELLGNYFVCMTWPNGANSSDKADWSPLYGRELLLWPDNDKAGRQAMGEIAARLSEHCPKIKIVDVSDLPPGHDLADCSTWNAADVIAWAKPRARLYQAEEQPPPVEPYEPTLDEQLAFNDDGKIICNMNNVRITLERHEEFTKKIWFDEFFNRAYTTIEGEPKPWRDAYDVVILAAIQGKLGIPHATRTMVREAVEEILLRNRRNSVRDWMDSLKWDGTARVSQFFKTYYSSRQPENYLAAVSKNFWVSMVARVMTPGCKADHMVILEGKQGAYKSTSLSAIGGEWFAEVHENMDSKDFALSLQGKLLVEIAELESFRRASDVTVIKKTLSCQVDRVRAPYGRTHEDLPRQCVLVGTTNQDIYLRDETGNRRYWPVLCGDIDIDGIRRDREQLFAEAVHLFRTGADWHDVPLDEATTEQNERQEDTDVWLDAISAFLKLQDGNPHYWTTPEEIAKECLKIPTCDFRASQMRDIRRCLKKCGYHTGLRKIEGEAKRVWTKSPAE